MKAKVVDHFLKGDAVPDWLIEARPTGPSSRMGSITFARPCCLLELADGTYFIVPTTIEDLGEDAALLTVANSHSIEISAVTRTITMPSEFLTMAYAGPRPKGQ